MRWPGEELRVALNNCPIASDGVTVETADRVEDAGPEVLERTRVVPKAFDTDQVKHEDRGALQVDDKDLARESGDKEEQRTQKENLEDDDEKERLRYQKRWLGPIRDGQPTGRRWRKTHRKSRPEKAKTVAIKEPVQRPPK